MRNNYHTAMILSGRTFAGVACLGVSVFALAFLNLQRTPVVATAPAANEDSDEQSGPYEAAVADSIASTKPQQYAVSSTTPQFVLFSFDGSKSVPMLNEIMAFEQHMKSEGKPVNFTYFINGVYFVTGATSGTYQGPGEAQGASNVGFSDTPQDISSRVAAFNKAFAEGDEIGSHTAGHFNGALWSYDDWSKEFASFNSLISNISTNNPSISADAPSFTPQNIVGFRAPYLAVNDNLYKTEADNHYLYDASGVNVSDNWPYKDRYGIWHIPLSFIHLGSNSAPVIAMDYNLWMRQSHAVEQAKRGTPLWDRYYKDVLSAYASQFDFNYTGNRAPIVIADHFSKWNDGVYWEAMKSFAENVCGLPNVHCVTFKDLTKYLDTTGVPSAAN